MRAVFRTEASAAIGGGHVMRDLALARALSSRGWASTFVCRPTTLETVSALADSGHRIVELDDGAADAAPLRAGDCELLVVDHYGLDVGFERACRAWARRILVIDDLAERRHDCDLLLDQTFGRDGGAYRDRVPPACRVLAGSSYALLRPEFAAARGAALARRRSATATRILVAMGLTDVGGATVKALDGIAASGVAAAVDVVLGSAAPTRAEIAARAAALSADVVVHLDSTDVAGLATRADLAIGAGGTTAWERCCLGLPTIMVLTADNQRQNGEALAAAGAVELLGSVADVTVADIGRAVAGLVADRAYRLAMSAAAAAVCDGLGATRVVAVIEALGEGRPQ